MNIQYKIPSALVMQRVTLELSSVVSLELSIVVSFRLDTHFRAITVDNQQDATILIYLILISSICFGRSFLPSLGAYYYNYSFWYCPPMLLLFGVAYATPTSV